MDMTEPKMEVTVLSMNTTAAGAAALHRSYRRLDVASLILLMVGLVCGGLSYWLIANHGWNALIFVPAVIASATGVAHLTKRVAARE